MSRLPFDRAGLLTGLSALLILLLAAALYWPGLSGGFLLDDQQNILALQKDASWSALLYGILHNESGLLGRSVAVASFYLSQWQFGTTAWGYKFHNLLVHLVNSLLLARLIYCTLLLTDPQRDKRNLVLIAGITASLWLLHPLLVSTVLYAVQRMTELAALFTLLSLLTYLKVRSMPRADWSFYWRAWLLLPLLLLLSLLSKETGVLIPVYMLVFEVCVLRTAPGLFKTATHQRSFVLVFVILPLLAGFALLLLGFDRLSDYSTRTFSMGERLLTQLHALAFYVKMIFLPSLEAMSLYHDDFPVSSSFDLLTGLLLVLLLLLLALIWYLRKSCPLVAFALAWFFASHLLESTFLPLELVFEHRNYLAAASLLLIPVYLVFTVEKLRAGRYATVLFLALFAFMTHTRAFEWSDNELLLTIAVKEHAGSARAHNAMANHLMLSGRVEQGLEHLKTAAALSPRDAGASLHLLGVECVNSIRDEDSLTLANTQLGQFPVTVYALNALDSLIGFMSKKDCDLITLEEFSTLVETALALESNTQNADRHAFLLRFRAIAAFLRGYYAQGVIAMREAHALTGAISYLGELTKYQIELGQLGDAADTLQLMEVQNSERLGMDSYQVNIASNALAQARQAQ